MIDNQVLCPTKFPQNQSWSIDYDRTDDWKSKKIVRKFINSAIYVEKPVSDMPPLRKKSPIFLNNSSDGEYTSRTYISDTNKTKREIRSSCISLNTCSPYCAEENFEVNIKKSCFELNESHSTSSSSNTGSQITVKNNKNGISKMANEMKLSLTSCSTLSTDRFGQIDMKEKENIIRKTKKKKNEELKIKEDKEKQRQLMIEKERENFKRWLAEKKQAEERNKRIKELEDQENKLKEAEKEKRRAENELSFNKWVRMKKKMDLERKIKEKLTVIKIYEEKQKRIEENEKAFDEWLRNSKNKPKPIALNQGLQREKARLYSKMLFPQRSLCSSTSVTYINPVPWMPNIELPQKPLSQ
ncbi:hypothetical protein NQ315_015143 [Exocentrus adspersus]|uniref:Coiled-coil domain-containing protein n=1 Tax=Exocentrus adspersus TaxID=1586481 RepID=A0AAV8VE88_9CUCU|nr:hypothetical protein NQ315_015143 [Exocentrus adspersus]